MMLTSNMPHLLNAMYDWLLENNLTPYLLCEEKGVSGVPASYFKDGVVILNINPVACAQLVINHEGVDFNTRFGTVMTKIHVNINAVKRIYAREVGVGMSFDDGESGPEEPLPVPPKPPSGKPHLKLIRGNNDKG